MATLRERRAKAEAKVLRAAKALESAKKELEDVLAAERVMAEITGESIDQKGGASSTSDRDVEIVKLLNRNQNGAKSPVELYPEYTEATGDSINLDAFRTALWRLQKKTIADDGKDWAVRSEGGRYWRECDSDDVYDLKKLLGD
ncbi:hypothetical protein NED98_15700 [Sphingomonas sp. MMSM20]|nr:hypothetical protein [Sphingomonas lycopersici]